MKTRKNVWTIMAAVLIGGLIAGFSLGSNLGCVFEKEQDSAEKPIVKTAEPGQQNELIKQLTQAFEKASGTASTSVVSIIAEQEVQIKRFGFPDDSFRDFFGDDFFERFFGRTPRQREQKRTIRSLGSGVIVTEDGYIVTNNHVIKEAENLYVLIGDDKRYEAEVIGTDPPTDMAVIKIKGKNFPAATLGDSDKLTVGQWVIAVGNPFQLMHTVTAGIISAQGRSSVGLAEYEDFIQTDASINPGNSGGALADLNGNVIGINTAIASPSGGNIGIGFAIPINMAREVMDQLITKGKVVRGYVGLWLQDITEDLAQAMDLENTNGALVADLVEDGPADRAGIQRGDVITAYDGEKIEDGVELKNMVAQTQPGTSVDITLIRNGEEKTVTVKLTERQEEETESQRQEQEKWASSRTLGLSVQTLTPALAQRLGYKNREGVVVTRVLSGSPASEAGLRRGDLIQEVNRRSISSEEEFEEALDDLNEGDVVVLLVRRGGNTFFATLRVPEK